LSFFFFASVVRGKAVFFLSGFFLAWGEEGGRSGDQRLLLFQRADLRRERARRKSVGFGLFQAVGIVTRHSERFCIAAFDRAWSVLRYP
jgi:hypothetical protein